VFQSVFDITPPVTPATDAFGKLNVCTPPAVDILNAVPPVPVAKLCDAFVDPFNELIAPAGACDTHAVPFHVNTSPVDPPFTIPTTFPTRLNGPLNVSTASFELNVFQSAELNKPVVLPSADGIFNVCTFPAELNPYAPAVFVTAKLCAAPVSPFKLVIPPPVNVTGTQFVPLYCNTCPAVAPPPFNWLTSRAIGVLVTTDRRPCASTVREGT
jgi:hypothetical protein